MLQMKQLKKNLWLKRLFSKFSLDYEKIVVHYDIQSVTYLTKNLEKKYINVKYHFFS